MPVRLKLLVTGAGKTLISIMLIKDKAKNLHRDKTFEAGRQITIFLAPKVALVWQVRQSYQTVEQRLY